MNHHNSPYFRDWLHTKNFFIILALVVIMLSGLFQFGIFALNKNHVMSYFGIEPEDVTFSIQISYVGILAYLPIQFRLIRYFEPKPYLLVVLLVAIAVNFMSLITTDFYIFLALRLLSGFIACSIVGRSLTILFGHLRKQYALVIGSTIFYGSVLASVVIVGLFSAWIADNMPWQCSYIYLISYNAITILVILLTLKAKADFKKYPLYQIDWQSFVLSIATFSAFAFLFIYGPKYDWLSNDKCLFATIITVVCLCLLVVRQGMLKRPYLHLHVFKSRRFILALALLGFYYGIKDSINLIYGYTGMVLHWNNQDIAQLGLANVSAMVLTMALSAYILTRKRQYMRLLFLGGFLCLFIFNFWMYLIIGHDLSFQALIGPVLLQGAASGGLFVPLAIFALESVPSYTGFTGITLAAVARFIGLLNASAGFYGLQQFYSQSYNTNFLNHFTPIDHLYNSQLAKISSMLTSKGYFADQAMGLSHLFLHRDMSIQSLLLTDRAIFKILAFTIGVLLMVMLACRLGKWLILYVRNQRSRPLQA